MPKRPVKHSLTISNHRTSVSLEEPFWDALRDIASERKCSIAELVSEVDSGRKGAGLSGSLRVFVLEYYRNKLREAQHLLDRSVTG